MINEAFSIATDINQRVTGYIVNTGFSDSEAHLIKAIQQEILATHPAGIWAVPRQALHITVLDLLTPVTDYSQNKDILFAELKNEWETALERILLNYPPIAITFDSVEVHPSAIIIRGHDDGSYKAIRQAFLDSVKLDARTKLPPTIIHSTICKFTQQLALTDMQATFIGKKDLFKTMTTEFRLARETKIFMQDYETIRRYPLH